MSARGLWRLAALALAATLVAGAVQWQRHAAPAPYRETLYLFGTLVEIETRGVAEAPARAAVAGVATHLQRLHRDWHAWRPGELGRLNAAIAAGDSLTVDPALADLLRRGRELSCASGGRFDPAIGAAIEAWGFHADTLPSGPPPSAARIAALQDARPQMRDLRIDGTRISARNPAIQLDLGAYAKGAALDLAMADLRAAGIRDAVLNAGGGVQVLGQPGARPWRVAIRDPFQWGVVAALSLRPGEALHSSGNYERFLQAGGVRLSHVLDPRSARPVQGIVSVSVLAETGLLADAASTALTVAGAEEWPQVAADMGVRAVLMITEDGTLMASPEMAARLEPVAGGFPSKVRVVALPGRAPRLGCAGD